MRGFDPTYRDPEDYILRCTARIWEGRDVAALDWHYADDLIVRTPAGLMRGNAAGKAATMATLDEFPDRVLLGEDVIWCPAAPPAGQEGEAFLSSHRIVSTATHRGGAFGPATGRRVAFRTIADTYCAADRVWDEWLIRDNGAIVRQLGGTPEAAARAALAAGAAPLTPETDAPGPYGGAGTRDAVSARHVDLLERVMAAGFDAVPAAYDRACHLSLPGGADVHGHAEATAFWLGLRAALPSAAFRVEHRIGRDDPGLPPRSAVRWSLTGRHEGRGRLGAPTGAPVHVMGVSHAEWGPRGLRRETTLFDEVAVWTQILRHAEA